MNINSFFELNKLTKQLSYCFEDIDPGLVDHEFFTKEINLALQKSTTAEDFFRTIVKLLKQQQDQNLVDSRSAINRAIKDITTGITNTRVRRSDTELEAKLSISDKSWVFDEGQLFLLCTNGQYSSEIYQHLLMDLAVDQKINLLSFIEQAKHDLILENLISSIKESDREQALQFNTRLVQLKNCRSYVEERIHYNASQFEEHLSYLCKKYKLHVVYLDDISILQTIASLEISKKDQLLQIGEFLLRLANKLNIGIIIKYQHEFSDVRLLKEEIGGLINYTSHALQFNKTLSQEAFKMAFFDLIDLKAYPQKALDAYFNTNKGLILKSSNDQ